jgi:hypothetical protein
MFAIFTFKLCYCVEALKPDESENQPTFFGECKQEVELIFKKMKLSCNPKCEKCETISIPRSLPSFHNVCPYFCSTMETNFFPQKTKENLS